MKARVKENIVDKKAYPRWAREMECYKNHIFDFHAVCEDRWISSGTSDWRFHTDWLEFIDEKTEKNTKEIGKGMAKKESMRVIVSKPAVTVVWENGSKNVVKTTPFDPEKALAMCFVEKDKPKARQIVRMSDTATLFIWSDWQTTATNLHMDEYDAEKAFAMAYVRKIMTRNQFEKMLKKAYVQEKHQ